MQISVANLVCITFLCIQAQSTPFMSRADNFLALACSLSLSVMFLCTIFYKNATLTELPAIRDRMSLEQRATYEIDGLGLSLIFMVCLFGALSFSAVMTAYQAVMQRKEHLDALARRLRYRDGKMAAQPMAIEKGHQYHLFLSHTWMQGQDQMRIVKRRLFEMLPGTFHFPLRVFLDVDDLQTGAGAELIDVSNLILVFATRKYFESRACARELIRVRRPRHTSAEAESVVLCMLCADEPITHPPTQAVLLRKRLLLVLEPDKGTERGGLSEVDIRKLILETHYRAYNSFGGDELSYDWVTKWKFDDEVLQWRADWADRAVSNDQVLFNDMATMPTPQVVADALFAEPAEEWNRLTGFQDVTLRRIAQRLLPQSHAKTAIYVPDEVINQKMTMAPLMPGRTYHLYASPHNVGASNITVELQGIVEQLFVPGQRQMLLWPHRNREPCVLRATHNVAELDKCDHMLVYLTNETWHSGETSVLFAKEIAEAMRLGIHLLLCYEMHSAMTEESLARKAVDFNRMWDEGATPEPLKVAGIYRQIAVSLKGGLWQPVGLAKAAAFFAQGGGERKPVPVGDIGPTDPDFDSAGGLGNTRILEQIGRAIRRRVSISDIGTRASAFKPVRGRQATLPGRIVRARASLSSAPTLGAVPCDNVLNSDTSGASSLVRRETSIPVSKEEELKEEEEEEKKEEEEEKKKVCRFAQDAIQSCTSVSASAPHKHCSQDFSRKKSCFVVDDELNQDSRSQPSSECASSGLQTAQAIVSANPLKDAPSRQCSRGTHTASRPGEQTARQRELAAQLSAKVQNRLQAKEEELARERANAVANAARALNVPSVNLRVRNRAHHFARAQAKEEAETEDLEGLGAAPIDSRQGSRCAMHVTTGIAHTRLRQSGGRSRLLPTAAALPPPGVASHRDQSAMLPAAAQLPPPGLASDTLGRKSLMPSPLDTVDEI